jgi:rhamnosyltransferase
MNDPKICAVIVSFHPAPQLLSNISILRPQVQGLVVVDNGSRPDELAPVQAAAGDLDFTLIENGRNLGIGAGLNIGVRWALQHGFAWVALFDQDSTAMESLISGLLTTAQSYPRPELVAITCPLYVDPDTMSVTAGGIPAKEGGVMVTMTSGSLIPQAIFQQCGYFNEDLFIDLVDFEYCLRVKRMGFLVLQSDKAVLLHRPGSPTSKFLFGRRLFAVSNHSAKRRYYLTRNTVWMVQRFWKDFPSLCLLVATALLQDMVKIALAEEDRWNKLKNMLLGAVHGLQGKLGNALNLE